MKWVIRQLAIMLFSYVRIYDNNGKLVDSAQILDNTCVIKLSAISDTNEGINNLELRVDKRGLRKLEGGSIRLYEGAKVGRFPLVGIDISKPLILNDLGQYFIEPKDDLSQYCNHEMTFLFDEDWLLDNHKSFLET